MIFCGREDSSRQACDLAGRAALFRAEADLLRERALASREPVIRDQYIALATRWSMFAAGLETELFARLFERDQTTLL